MKKKAAPGAAFSLPRLSGQQAYAAFPAVSLVVIVIVIVIATLP
jgi:hypothetical protein